MVDVAVALPEPRPGDDEDVVWGLSTAVALWARGERGDAIVWLRRAADAAGAAGQEARAAELLAGAVQLEQAHETLQRSLMPPPPSTRSTADTLPEDAIELRSMELEPVPSEGDRASLGLGIEIDLQSAASIPPPPAPPRRLTVAPPAPAPAPAASSSRVPLTPPSSGAPTPRMSTITPPPPPTSRAPSIAPPPIVTPVAPVAPVTSSLRGAPPSSTTPAASRPKTAARSPILDPWAEEPTLPSIRVDPSVRAVQVEGDEVMVQMRRSQPRFVEDDDGVVTSAAPIEATLRRALSRPPPPPTPAVRKVTASGEQPPGHIADAGASVPSKISIAPSRPRPQTPTPPGPDAGKSGLHVPRAPAMPTISTGPSKTGAVSAPPAPSPPSTPSPRSSSASPSRPASAPPPRPASVPPSRPASAPPPRPASVPPPRPASVPPPRLSSPLPSRPASLPPAPAVAAFDPLNTPTSPATPSAIPRPRAVSVPPPAARAPSPPTHPLARTMPSVPSPLRVPSPLSVRPPPPSTSSASVRPPAPAAPVIPAAMRRPSTTMPAVPRPAPLPRPELVLDEVEAFADLSPDMRQRLVTLARVQALSADEEVSSFGAALVIDGHASVCATIVDAPAHLAAPGDLVPARGTLAELVALRVVAGAGGARVAVWDAAALEDTLRSSPWVLEELVARADRLQAFAGATMGPLGELDDAVRARLLPRFSVRVAPPREVILGAGVPVPGVILVCAGAIELGDGSLVRAGEVLFPKAALDGAPASSVTHAAASGAILLLADRALSAELAASSPLASRLAR